jgi:hypothetical protein
MALFFLLVDASWHLSVFQSSHSMVVPVPMGLDSAFPFAGRTDGGCWSVLGPLVEQVEVI